MGSLNRNIPQNLTNKIIKLYNEDLLAMEAIADSLNISFWTVWSALKLSNIDTSFHNRIVKTKNINEHYFKKLNKNSAYLLGFLMADGYVRKTDSSHVLGINLAPKDIEILEFIQKEICPNSDIKKYFSNKNKKGKRISIKVYNKTIFDDLAQYGIIPNKTGKEELKNIPKHLGPHFLRGFFDGDGSIIFQQKILGDKRCRNLMKIFCSNLSFIESLRNYFDIPIGSIKSAKTKNGYLYTWHIQSIHDLFYMYEYMYSKGGFKLKRKYNKFKQLINHFKDTKYATA